MTSWRGLILSLLVVGTAPLVVITNAGRLDDPWPALLAGEDTGDLRVAMLQYRANATLQKLVHSAPVYQ